MMQRQAQIYDRPPRQAAFDGSFAERANLEALKELVVEDVVFSKGRGLSVTEMASSVRVYQRLRSFRAGVESVISSLKRVFGWDRCNWRSVTPAAAPSDAGKGPVCPDHRCLHLPTWLRALLGHPQGHAATLNAASPA